MFSQLLGRCQMKIVRILFYLLLLLTSWQLSARRVWAGSGELAFQQQKKLGSSDDPYLNFNNWVMLNFSNEKRRTTFESFFELKARYYYASEDRFLFALPQAYIQSFDDNQQFKIAVGRKVMDWAPYESFWGTGIINGHQGLNLLEMEDEGKSGVHCDFVGQGWSWNLFASYLHVPSMNQGVSQTNRQLQPKSQWSRVPPQELRFQGQLRPIYYQVDIPPAQDIIWQESFGTRFAIQWASGEVALHGMYLPENELRINATGRLNDDENGDYQGRLKVRPFVNHQQVYGASFVQKIGNFKVNIGHEEVIPNRESAKNFRFDHLRFAPTYQDQSLVFADVKFQRPVLEVSVSYLKNLKEYLPDPLGMATASFKWHEALGMKLRYLFTDVMSFATSYRRDLKKQDNLFNGQLNYSFLKTMDLAIGLELLTVEDRRSYWYPFRSNDTVYSTLTYLF